jgi:hypothetical protein
VIVLTRPEDQERDRHKSKKGKKTTFKREDKSWRANQKSHNPNAEEDMEDLMLKFNQQFKCKSCQGISSIYAPECTTCGEPNPHPATHTH